MAQRWNRLVKRAAKSNPWAHSVYLRRCFDRVALRQRSNNGTYAIDINCNTGFFAQLTWCLFILQHCENNALQPRIRLSSPHYARNPGDNWLDDFFTPRSPVANTIERCRSEDLAFTTISDIDELGLSAFPRPRLNIAEGHRLFNKYLAVREDIQGHVDAFVGGHFSPGRTLGLHFRGTDKVREATPVSQEACIEVVRRYLDFCGSIDTVFVSSDEQSFVELLQRRMKSVRVVAHQDTARSRDGRAVHALSVPGDNYAKGFEAIVNCLLLARCNVLMRTASFLSAWSSIFSPSLPVIMLNRPIDSRLWFPDREILHDAVALCLPALPPDSGNVDQGQ